MSPLGGAAPPPPSSSNLSPLAPPFTADPDRPRPWSIFAAPSPAAAAAFYPSVSAGGEAVYAGWGVGVDHDSGGGGLTWSNHGLPAVEEGYFGGPVTPFKNCSGVWHGKDAGSFTGKVHLGSGTSDWLYDRHTSVYEEELLGPTIASRESDLAPTHLPKGSSSNFSSCDAFMGYSTNSCSISTKLNDPSSRGTNSFVELNMLKYGYVVDQHLDPHKIGTGLKDQSLSNPKVFNMKKKVDAMVQPVDQYQIGTCSRDQLPRNEAKLSDNQFVEVTEFYDGMLGKGNPKIGTGMPVYTFSSRTSLPSCSEIANESSTSTSLEVETGFNLKPLVLPGASVLGSELADPSNCNGTSQAADQINFYVDSPCWKGALTSRRSTFSVAETLDVGPAVQELIDFDNSEKDQKDHTLEVANSEILPSQQVGDSICNENAKTSPGISSSKPSVVILPSIQKNLDDASKAGNACSKDNNDLIIYNLDASEDQNSNVGIVQNRNSEENDIEAISLEKEEIIVSSVPLVKSGPHANIETDIKPESHGNHDVGILVKTLNSLSEVLLSLCNVGANELEEQDHELLKSTVCNLELLTHQSKKVIASGGFDATKTEAAGTHDICLEPDIRANSTNIIMNHDMKGKLNCSSNISKGGIEELSKTNMAQTFEKVFEETLLEQEENPDVLIFKNLWIEAEAALCSMKYDLQLSRMKIEMPSNKHLLKGRYLQVSSSSFGNSMHLLDGGASLQKVETNLANITPHQVGAVGNCCSNVLKSRLETTDKGEEVVDSLFARVGDLKSRVDNSDSALERQQNLGVTRDRLGEIEVISTENNVAPQNLAAKLSDLAFMESIPHSQSNTINCSQKKGKGKVRIQFPGGRYNAVCHSGVSGDTSSEVSDGKGFVQSPYKSYALIGQSASSGGYANPSSEWEHVLKEDHTI